MFGFLAAYAGPAGPVSSADVLTALGLMGKGMLGIFIVMALIYLLTYILNRTTGKDGR